MPSWFRYRNRSYFLDRFSLFPEVDGPMAVSIFRNLFPATPRPPETSGLQGQRKAVQTTLVSNSIEFDGIKIRIIELLPNAKKFNGIPVTHPVLDDVVASLRIAVPGNIRQRDKIFFPVLVNYNAG